MGAESSLQLVGWLTNGGWEGKLWLPGCATHPRVPFIGRGAKVKETELSTDVTRCLGSYSKTLFASHLHYIQKLILEIEWAFKDVCCVDRFIKSLHYQQRKHLRTWLDIYVVFENSRGQRVRCFRIRVLVPVMNSKAASPPSPPKARWLRSMAPLTTTSL